MNFGRESPPWSKRGKVRAGPRHVTLACLAAYRYMPPRSASRDPPPVRGASPVLVPCGILYHPLKSRHPRASPCGLPVPRTLPALTPGTLPYGWGSEEGSWTAKIIATYLDCIQNLGLLSGYQLLQMSGCPSYFISQCAYT